MSMNFKIKRNEKLNVERHTKYKNTSTDKEKGTCIFDDLCVQTIQFMSTFQISFFKLLLNTPDYLLSEANNHEKKIDARAL